MTNSPGGIRSPARTDAMVRLASNRFAGFALLGLVGVEAVFAAYVGLTPDRMGLSGFFNNGVYHAITIGSLAVIFARGVFVERERAVWLVLALALASSTVGDLYYTNAFSDPDNIPFPSLADAFYLGFFPLCCVAIALLVRSRIGSFGPSLWLDGIVAGLTVAAIVAALVFQTVLDVTTGTTAAVVTNLAYPLADFTLIGLAVGAIAVSGWRLDRTWRYMLGGLVVYAVADSIYLYQSSIGTYVEGRILDAAWPFFAVLLAFAAWQPITRREARIEGWASIVLPPLFALVSIGVVVFDQFQHITRLAVFLACGALGAVLVRLLITFSENLSLIGLQREYIEEVGHVVDAAAAVEAETFEVSVLDGVAKREDALGNLARVFQRMAREVYEREQRLKAQVQQLRIEIDEARAAQKVAEITDTDYFRDLQEKASALRLGGDAPTAPE